MTIQVPRFITSGSRQFNVETVPEELTIDLERRLGAEGLRRIYRYIYSPMWRDIHCAGATAYLCGFVRPGTRVECDELVQILHDKAELVATGDVNKPWVEGDTSEANVHAYYYDDLGGPDGAWGHFGIFATAQDGQAWECSQMCSSEPRFAELSFLLFPPTYPTHYWKVPKV